MRVFALLAAVVILLAGTLYTVNRSPKYQSTSALVLAPTAADSSDRTGLINGYDRSGAIGTFVELIASPDTLVAAGQPPVTIDVRAIPDTRVIEVTATGERDVVRPALTALLAAARGSQSTLNDLWTLRVLETPSAAEEAGPSVAMLLAATVLLALLAALFLYVAVSAVVRMGATETPVSGNGDGAGATDGVTVSDRKLSALATGSRRAR